MKNPSRTKLISTIIGTGVLLAGVISFAGMTASAGTTPMLNLYSDKANWSQAFNQVGQFEAQKYGVGFKSVPYADTTSYQAAIDQSIVGSNPPDLLTWWTGDQFKKLVSTGKLADLTNEWKVYEKEGLNPGFASSFTVNGRIYGAPLYVGYWDVYYNKQIFQKYGLKTPKTWSQFIALCNTLKSHGVTPLGQSINGGWPGFIWFEELLVRSDPTLYNKLMVGKASYTDPGVVKVMQLWKNMEDKGYFSKPEDMSTGVPGDFAKGKIAMYLVGDWYQSTLTQAGLKPGVDYDAFTLPDVNPKAGNVIIYETGPIAVSKNGKNEQEALKALRAFYEPDTQTEWDNAQGFSPIVKGVKSHNIPDTHIANELKSAKYTMIQRYWEATPPDVGQFAVNYFDKFILHPDTYMQDLKTIQTFAANYWASHK